MKQVKMSNKQVDANNDWAPQQMRASKTMPHLNYTQADIQEQYLCNTHARHKQSLDDNNKSQTKRGAYSITSRGDSRQVTSSTTTADNNNNTNLIRRAQQLAKFSNDNENDDGLVTIPRALVASATSDRKKRVVASERKSRADAALDSLTDDTTNEHDDCSPEEPTAVERSARKRRRRHRSHSASRLLSACFNIPHLASSIVHQHHHQQQQQQSGVKRGGTSSILAHFKLGGPSSKRPLSSSQTEGNLQQLNEQPSGQLNNNSTRAKHVSFERRHRQQQQQQPFEERSTSENRQQQQQTDQINRQQAATNVIVRNYQPAAHTTSQLAANNSSSSSSPMLTAAIRHQQQQQQQQQHWTPSHHQHASPSSSSSIYLVNQRPFSGCTTPLRAQQQQQHHHQVPPPTIYKRLPTMPMRTQATQTEITAYHLMAGPCSSSAKNSSIASCAHLSGLAKGTPIATRPLVARAAPENALTTTTKDEFSDDADDDNLLASSVPMPNFGDDDDDDDDDEITQNKSSERQRRGHADNEQKHQNENTCRRRDDDDDDDEQQNDEQDDDERLVNASLRALSSASDSNSSSCASLVGHDSALADTLKCDLRIETTTTKTTPTTKTHTQLHAHQRQSSTQHNRQFVETAAAEPIEPPEGFANDVQATNNNKVKCDDDDDRPNDDCSRAPSPPSLSEASSQTDASLAQTNVLERIGRALDRDDRSAAAAAPEVARDNYAATIKTIRARHRTGVLPEQRSLDASACKRRVQATRRSQQHDKLASNDYGDSVAAQATRDSQQQQQLTGAGSGADVVSQRRQDLYVDEPTLPVDVVAPETVPYSNKLLMSGSGGGETSSRAAEQRRDHFLADDTFERLERRGADDMNSDNNSRSLASAAADDDDEALSADYNKSPAAIETSAPQQRQANRGSGSSSNNNNDARVRSSRSSTSTLSTRHHSYCSANCDELRARELTLECCQLNDDNVDAHYSIRRQSSLTQRLASGGGGGGGAAEDLTAPKKRIAALGAEANLNIGARSKLQEDAEESEQIDDRLREQDSAALQVAAAADDSRETTHDQSQGIVGAHKQPLSELSREQPHLVAMRPPPPPPSGDAAAASGSTLSAQDFAHEAHYDNGARSSGAGGGGENIDKDDDAVEFAALERQRPIRQEEKSACNVSDNGNARKTRAAAADDDNDHLGQQQLCSEQVACATTTTTTDFHQASSSSQQLCNLELTKSHMQLADEILSATPLGADRITSKASPPPPPPPLSQEPNGERRKTSSPSPPTTVSELDQSEELSTPSFVDHYKRRLEDQVSALADSVTRALISECLGAGASEDLSASSSSSSETTTTSVSGGMYVCADGRVQRARPSVPAKPAHLQVVAVQCKQQQQAAAVAAAATSIAAAAALHSTAQQQQQQQQMVSASNQAAQGRAQAASDHQSDSINRKLIEADQEELRSPTTSCNDDDDGSEQKAAPQELWRTSSTSSSSSDTSRSLSSQRARERAEDLSSTSSSILELQSSSTPPPPPPPLGDPAAGEQQINDSNSECALKQQSSNELSTVSEASEEQQSSIVVGELHLVSSSSTTATVRQADVTKKMSAEQTGAADDDEEQHSQATTEMQLIDLQATEHDLAQSEYTLTCDDSNEDDDDSLSNRRDGSADERTVESGRKCIERGALVRQQSASSARAIVTTATTTTSARRRSLEQHPRALPTLLDCPYVHDLQPLPTTSSVSSSVSSSASSAIAAAQPQVAAPLISNSPALVKRLSHDDTMEAIEDDVEGEEHEMRLLAEEMQKRKNNQNDDDDDDQATQLSIEPPAEFGHQSVLACVEQEEEQVNAAAADDDDDEPSGDEESSISVSQKHGVVVTQERTTTPPTTSSQSKITAIKMKRLRHESSESSNSSSSAAQRTPVMSPTSASSSSSTSSSSTSSPSSTSNNRTDGAANVQELKSESSQKECLLLEKIDNHSDNDDNTLHCDVIDSCDADTPTPTKAGPSQQRDPVREKVVSQEETLVSDTQEPSVTTMHNKSVSSSESATHAILEHLSQHHNETIIALDEPSLGLEQSRSVDPSQQRRASWRHTSDSAAAAGPTHERDSSIAPTAAASAHEQRPACELPRATADYDSSSTSRTGTMKRRRQLSSSGGGGELHTSASVSDERVVVETAHTIERAGSEQLDDALTGARSSRVAAAAPLPPLERCVQSERDSPTSTSFATKRRPPLKQLKSQHHQQHQQQQQLVGGQQNSNSLDRADFDMSICSSCSCMDNTSFDQQQVNQAQQAQQLTSVTETSCESAPLATSKAQTRRETTQQTKQPQSSSWMSQEEGTVFTENYWLSHWLYISEHEEAEIWRRAIDMTSSSHVISNKTTTTTNDDHAPGASDEQQCSNFNKSTSTTGMPRDMTECGSTISERNFSTRYKSTTRKMIHRRASVEMYRRIVGNNLKKEKCVEISRSNGEFGFRIHGSRPVVVSAIERGTSAETCGLQVGDLIYAINGTNVLDMAHSDVVKLAHSADSGALVLDLIPTNDFLRMSKYNRTQNKRYEPTVTGFLMRLSPSTAQPLLVELQERMSSNNKGQQQQVASNSMQQRAAELNRVMRLAWRQRFFVLRSDNCLYWYKSAYDTIEPHGGINLQGFSATLTDEFSEPNYVIRLVKYGGQPHYLGSNNMCDVQTWVDAINRAATEANQNDPYMKRTLVLARGKPGDINEHDCAGWLYKFSHKRGGGAHWRAAYFVLKDACLYLYRDQRHELVEQASAVYYLHGYRVRAKHIEHKRHTFELVPPNRKTIKPMFLMASNEIDKKRWIAALEYSIDRWIEID